MRKPRDHPRGFRQFPADKSPTCKKCGAAISSIVIVETREKMLAACHALGMTETVAEALIKREGPLCRKCEGNWGTGEERPD